MKKIFIYIVMFFISILIGVQSGSAGSPADQSVIATNQDKFLSNIEIGIVDAEVFINAIKQGDHILENISHSAIANYMEALANEGMLKLIPLNDYSYEDIQTSLNVVFEDRDNVTNNWSVFEDQWLAPQICR